MAIRVAFRHETTYRYDRLVRLTPQVVRLRPAPHCRTPVPSYALRVSPSPHFLNWQQDPQSNWLARLVFPDPVDHLRVAVDLVAELTVINPFDFFLEPDAETLPFAYDPWLSKELAPFLETEVPGPRLRAWLGDVRPEGRTVDFLVALNQRLTDEVRYLIRMEPGVQTCEETLERGSGSCRDSAWLLVQILRHQGLAARFVSGYLIQLAPDERPREGPAGPERDFTDLHAWAEVYLPGAGWVGLDPTSGLLAGEGHLPLAATPDPASAAPITGGVGECEVSFDFAMDVQRIHEDPRVTRPYTDAEWARIEALGEQVDADLAAGDVRLTQGGEPTFVAVDDMEGDEWNYEALGEEKYRRSEALLRRMQRRLAPGGILQFGQGKWYPGESLPRWVLSCYWRKDGEPIWRDRRLLAGSEVQPEAKFDDALRFARTLARDLGVNPEAADPAFEDPWHFLQQEGALPVNVDPFDSRLDDPEERERLRRVFDRGLGEPVGVVLPLQRVRGRSGPEWQTGLWMLRGRHLTLVPGDSPVGLRLPLHRLPWQEPVTRGSGEPLDPSVPRPPLPPHPGEPGRRAMPGVGADGHPGLDAVRPPRTPAPDRMPAPAQSADWVVRTALCVEPRDGRLHVFLPPVTLLEDWLDLVASVEATAAATGLPVVLEGYPPPGDPRLDRFSITPDPGVVEVNVRPVASWRALVNEVTDLYADAREERLGTEKFMLDGRHTGTGGGNHITLGGPSPLESPFLRRPDLLRSLVGYWLNHPSLSYLFSGLFIGPTSQAPRVDEARHESVYELEIAFAQVPEPGVDCPPWLVDRLFRNLLLDVTGNTHRAEFCIDKLYAPETASGRLGVLELRAFEMPPHARMSLTQQLLLRALVARFWREPYRARPIRWGTRLHDRFLLPHFVDADLREVLEELGQHGYAFERRWFDSHFEFRFPKIGVVAPAGVELELRHAIEPWHVLGEQPGGGGNVRFVDSSLERIQVKARGLVGDRFAVTCNGRRLPLHPTGTEGESVAGVRFRAWQPASCLHPTIPVHTPLVFDLFDGGAGRSLGGCTYHVSHPGGRHYDVFPVNAFEAEARRAGRFQPFGHTPGPMALPTSEGNPQYPHTLDLRRGGS